jgi:RNA polymerase sigma factor (TIGR02999 family)
MVSEPGEITGLLRRWSGGDVAAQQHIIELVLPELRKIAGRLMVGERADHTLQPTALVNEIYFKLAGIQNLDWQDRTHFFAIVAKSMRRFLIDYGRQHQALDHFIGEDVAGSLSPGHNRVDLAIEVDRLLEELAREEPEQCAVVELKYFLGLTDEEAAEAMQTPLRTIQRRWRKARKWLFERLRPQECNPQAMSKTNSS